MAQELSVAVDLHDLLTIGPLVRAQIFSNLSGAVERIAQAGEERWKMAALNANLWEGERRAYASSIRYAMKGPYAAEISCDYKFVEDIETGRPAYDLKRMLDTSPKVRRTKDGRRFLVIPMRHNTPGAQGGMSPEAYAVASELSPSRIASQGHRPAGEVTEFTRKGGMRASSAEHQTPFLSNPKTKGQYLVRKHVYEYGGRLTRKALIAGGASAQEAKKLAGAYRFNTSAGGGKSSAYISFRMMVEGSSGWVIPAKPGLYLGRNVADSLQRTAAADLPAAIQADLSAA